MNNLKLLGMRKELIQYLEGLSNLEYQKKIWVAGKSIDGTVHDELDYAIHFLYDDTELATDPNSLIGWILLDQCEADSIRNLTCAIDRLFEINGLELTDEEYIQKNEWPSVVSAAFSAKAIITEN